MHCITIICLLLLESFLKIYLLLVDSVLEIDPSQLEGSFIADKQALQISTPKTCIVCLKGFYFLPTLVAIDRACRCKCAVLDSQRLRN